MDLGGTKMKLTQQRVDELNKLCHKFRRTLIDMLYKVQTGHPGGSLSCTEIITTLYFEKMNVESDRFVLSKGHAAPMLYINLANKGFFKLEDLDSLRQINCHLQGHPCKRKTPGVQISTGALGLGLSAGLGLSLSDRLNQKDNYTYVLIGDGEIQEGAIWEAAMSAYKFKADHLIAILDLNGVQLDGTTEEIMPMGNVADKWTAFGWNVIHADGHNIADFADAIDKAKENRGTPTIIIAKTVKGKGISFMEGKNAWHGKPIGEEEYKQAINELGA